MKSNKFLKFVTFYANSVHLEEVSDSKYIIMHILKLVIIDNLLYLFMLLTTATYKSLNIKLFNKSCITHELRQVFEI